MQHAKQFYLFPGLSGGWQAITNETHEKLKRFNAYIYDPFNKHLGIYDREQKKIEILMREQALSETPELAQMLKSCISHATSKEPNDDGLHSYLLSAEELNQIQQHTDTFLKIDDDFNGEMSDAYQASLHRNTYILSSQGLYYFNVHSQEVQQVETAGSLQDETKQELMTKLSAYGLSNRGMCAISYDDAVYFKRATKIACIMGGFGDTSIMDCIYRMSKALNGRGDLQEVFSWLSGAMQTDPTVILELFEGKAQMRQSVAHYLACSEYDQQKILRESMPFGLHRELFLCANLVSTLRDNIAGKSIDEIYKFFGRVSRHWYNDAVLGEEWNARVCEQVSLGASS